MRKSVTFLATALTSALSLWALTSCGPSSFSAGTGKTNDQKKSQDSGRDSQEGPAKQTDASGSDTKNSEKTDKSADGVVGEGSASKDPCVSALGGGSKGDATVFVNGNAVATSGTGSDKASVSCGDLRLQADEDGECHLVIAQDSDADLSGVTVKVNGKIVYLDEDNSAENKLGSGTYSIAMESKVGGAFSSCSISVTVPKSKGAAEKEAP